MYTEHTQVRYIMCVQVAKTETLEDTKIRSFTSQKRTNKVSRWSKSYMFSYFCLVAGRDGFLNRKGWLLVGNIGRVEISLPTTSPYHDCACPESWQKAFPAACVCRYELRVISWKKSSLTNCRHCIFNFHFKIKNIAKSIFYCMIQQIITMLFKFWQGIVIMMCIFFY